MFYVCLLLKAPESRGRGQLPWRNLSPSAPTDIHPVKPMRHLSFSLKHTDSLPVSKFSSQSKHTPDVTTKSDTSNTSPTLFNVVTSLSANDKLGPSCHLKADGSKKTELLTSSDFPATHRKDRSISSDDTKLATRTKQTKKTITMLDLSNATCTDTFHTSCSQLARFSHERSHRAAIDSTSALENALRPRPGKIQIQDVRMVWLHTCFCF